jgi:hypothetical protein
VSQRRASEENANTIVEVPAGDRTARFIEHSTYAMLICAGRVQAFERQENKWFSDPDDFPDFYWRRFPFQSKAVNWLRPFTVRGAIPYSSGSRARLIHTV